MTITDATAPHAMLRMFAGMQIVEAHQHPAGIVLELCPLGHMSRRWLYLEGVIAVSDVSDPPAATYRNRRGITEQQHVDIGDDMHEKEREDRE